MQCGLVKWKKFTNIAEAIVAKHRHGPISRVKLHFNALVTQSFLT